MGVPSAHVDTFARDNLPPIDQWPVFLFDHPTPAYPERLNVTAELVDRRVDQGAGDWPAVADLKANWTYAELQRQIDAFAHVLVGRYGLVPGNRVLLRAPNNPMLVALYLGALKAGAVVVATMPLLRRRELRFIIDKAKIGLAFCDDRLLAELQRAAGEAETPVRVVPFGGERNDDLSRELASLPADAGPFPPCDTAADDVCLIAFTSGTTGTPKATVHFHRDLLATCDTYGRHVLKANASDIFIGSPPVAFTFGLGGLVLFPLRIGASTILLEKAGPPELLEAIRAAKPTICFTAPTAYRRLLELMRSGDMASLRRCVSAGETLPAAIFHDWKAATGIEIMDGIGSTEMLHIFIGAPPERIRAGATGLPVPGYEARVLAEDGGEADADEIGLLAVRGPTGCRYLADPRQKDYVQDGWNITGDLYRKDDDGYFWYVSRADDMIVTAGYNVGAPEVEAVLLAHPAVAECGVVGVPDSERGQIVRAYVVLKHGESAGPEMVETLRDFVKSEIAPYKCPRQIIFVESLPRTETGKLQRFQLRQDAKAYPR